MKSVSRKYKKSMAQTLRNHSYCTIVFGNIDITAVTDGTWNVDNGHLAWSNITTLDFDHEYADTVATLELNRWTLDGSQTILNGQNDGWVSASLSGANGIVDAYVQKTFSNPHILSGLTATWDINNHPIEANHIYGNSTTQVVNPTSETTEIAHTGSDITSVKIEFKAMLPYTRPHLHETSWGVGIVFQNDDIVSVKMNHDVDPLSRRLPSEKLSFTVFDYEHKYDPENPQGIYAYINTGAPLKIQYQYDLGDGTLESIKPDIYMLQNKPTFKDQKVTFSGCGLTESLVDSYYKSQMGTKTFYNMALAVLQDANLTPTPQGGNPWDIDVSLQNMSTTAVLPIDTHMNCLQKIAHATRCRLYTDDDNIIHLKPFGVSPTGIFNGEFSDSGHAYWSEWDTVDYGTENAETYATLELNRWELGSPMSIIPDDSFYYEKEGYISNVADGYGYSNCTWQREYDVLHDLPLINITFDNVLNEYPIEIKVQYFDDGGTEAGSAVYVNPEDVMEVIEAEYREDIRKIVVSMVGNLPYYRSRISKVSYRETDFSLTFDSIKENQHSTSVLERVKNIYVSEYNYSADGNVTELYSCTTTSTFVHAEYQLAQNISISVTGGTYTANVYAQAADITLTPTVVGGQMTVTITGKTLTENSSVHTIAVNTQGEDDKEENHLITSPAMALALGNHVKTYLALRNTYDDSYRGNPELETGDIIEMQTHYSSVVYGLVLTDEITFNGSLKGKVKVKGLV